MAYEAERKVPQIIDSESKASSPRACMVCGRPADPRTRDGGFCSGVCARTWARCQKVRHQDKHPETKADVLSPTLSGGDDIHTVYAREAEIEAVTKRQAIQAEARDVSASAAAGAADLPHLPRLWWRGTSPARAAEMIRRYPRGEKRLYIQQYTRERGRELGKRLEELVKSQ
jgi:hypothetical protein